MKGRYIFSSQNTFLSQGAGRKKNTYYWMPLIFSGVILVALIFMALFAEYIAPYNPNDGELAQRLLPLSAKHLLGTDHLGRDVFSRLIYGARYSLGSVGLIALCIVITGFITGAVAGYMGGWIDAVIMRICELFMTFQTFILAMFLIGILGTGLTNVIIAIVVTHWAWYSRIVRSIVLGLKNKEFILAARVAGAGPYTVFLRHIALPVFVQLIILATLDLGHMMLHVSGLSFLGLGVQPPTAEWGVMINDARSLLWSNPEQVILPGLMIFLAVLSCNIPSEYLRDKLDPSFNYNNG